MRVDLRTFGWFPAVNQFRDGDGEEAGEEEDEGDE